MALTIVIQPQPQHHNLPKRVYNHRQHRSSSTSTTSPTSTTTSPIERYQKYSYSFPIAGSNNLPTPPNSNYSTSPNRDSNIHFKMAAPNNNDNGASNTTHGYIDSATSTVKNAVNSVTGNTATDTTATSQQPQQQQSQQQPDATQPTGQYNQTIGSAKQTMGSALGNATLRRAGEQQNAQGEQEEAARQVGDWSEGVGERVKGKVGEVLAAGDPDAERSEEWKRMHDEGKARQKGTEEEIGKRW